MKSIFVYHNENPAGKETGDCVIRAVAFALNKSWEEIYDEFVEKGRECHCLPNAKDVYEPYLDAAGVRMPAMWTDDKGKRHRYTIKTLSKQYPTGTYVLRTAHHMTVMKDGQCVDLWDCSDKAAYIIWRINDNTER